MDLVLFEAIKNLPLIAAIVGGLSTAVIGGKIFFAGRQSGAMHDDPLIANQD